MKNLILLGTFVLLGTSVFGESFQENLWKQAKNLSVTPSLFQSDTSEKIEFRSLTDAELKFSDALNKIYGSWEKLQIYSVPADFQLPGTEFTYPLYAHKVLRGYNKGKLYYARPVETTTGCSGYCLPLIFHLVWNEKGQLVDLLTEIDRPLTKAYHVPWSDREIKKMLGFAKKIPKEIFSFLNPQEMVSSLDQEPKQTLSFAQKLVINGAAYTSYRILETAVKTQNLLFPIFSQESKEFENWTEKLFQVDSLENFLKLKFPTWKKPSWNALSERMAVLQWVLSQGKNQPSRLVSKATWCEVYKLAWEELTLPAQATSRCPGSDVDLFQILQKFKNSTPITTLETQKLKEHFPELLAKYPNSKILKNWSQKMKLELAPLELWNSSQRFSLSPSMLNFWKKDGMQSASLVVLFATWCPHCREWIHKNQKEIEQRYGKGLLLIEAFSRNVDGRVEFCKQMPFANEFCLSWPRVPSVETSEKLFEKLQMRFVPYFIFVDKQGRVSSGPLNNNEMLSEDFWLRIEKTLDALQKESNP